MSSERKPYIRMDGTRRPSIFALDRDFTPKKQQATKDSSNAFAGVPLVCLAGTGETLRAALRYMLFALCGSVLVSYTRARAEGLGFSGKVGIFSRIERSIVLILGLVVNELLISVGIIAILANVTALQRIFFVWKQSKQA